MLCGMRRNQKTGVEKLLEAAEGSPTAVAKRLSSGERHCKRQHVEYWMKQGYVPGNWALAVEKEFGIPLHELNPAIYPHPQSADRAHHDAA